MKFLKRLLVLGSFGAFFVLSLIFFADNRVKTSSSKRIVVEASDIPEQSVLLVLGCSPQLANGQENQFFKTRIDAASEAYQSGKVAALLVSGDNSRKKYDEATEMKEALVMQGVPEKIIYSDYAGFSTLESVIRANKIFGLNSYVIISQRFHVERAIYLSQGKGMNVLGYLAKDVGGTGGKLVLVREYLARVKALLDVHVLKTKPKFLGERISIKEIQ